MPPDVQPSYAHIALARCRARLTDPVSPSVIRALQRMMAMRSYQRSKHVDNEQNLAVLAQVAAFVVLSFVSIQVYRKWFRKAARASDQPLLNRRGEQLVGQVYVLEQPIVDGRGRLKIGDAFWAAEGEDLPQGTRVRVISAYNMSLQVRAVD